MSKEHKLAQRRQLILAAVDKVGELSVSALGKQFGVSEVTIRQDLQALSEQGLLLRTRGGALAINSMPEYSFDVRLQQKASEKVRIGQAAAQLVNHGDTIFLDASTTAQALIPFIKRNAELTVITNSLKVAMSLLDSPQVHVIVPGGSLRRESISLVGYPEEDVSKVLNIRLGFFGMRGLTIDEGLTDVNLNEVAVKRAMVKRCRQVIGVTDARKWGNVATSTFAQLDEVDTIISNMKVPDELAMAVRQQGVEVILV
ncbi:MAG: DeoR/GlpR family DNA-binding transcription regulator [Chloroflexota bacterium]